MALASVSQLQSGEDVAENLAAAALAIREASEAGSKLIALPEEFLTLGLTRDAKKAISEPYQNGPLQNQLATFAKTYGIWVVAGTLPIQAPSGKIAASCIIFDDTGDIRARYDKMHLFDVMVSKTEKYCESEAYDPGKKLALCDTPIGRVGLSICYDLRFPEHYRALVAKGAEVIIIPSAFTIPTGKAHWEILVRARAIENLAYVLAPNEAGFRNKETGTYGHSIIVDPWGEIIANATTGNALLTADINIEKMQKIRSEFPVLTHRQHTVVAFEESNNYE